MIRYSLISYRGNLCISKTLCTWSEAIFVCGEVNTTWVWPASVNRCCFRTDCSQSKQCSCSADYLLTWSGASGFTKREASTAYLWWPSEGEHTDAWWCSSSCLFSSLKVHGFFGPFCGPGRNNTLSVILVLRAGSYLQTSLSLDIF